MKIPILFTFDTLNVFFILIGTSVYTLKMCAQTWQKRIALTVNSKEAKLKLDVERSRNSCCLTVFESLGLDKRLPSKPDGLVRRFIQNSLTVLLIGPVFVCLK